MEKYSYEKNSIIFNDFYYNNFLTLPARVGKGL